MISRVAENAFWFARYIERVEGSCRLISLAHMQALDFADSALDVWLPAIIVSGEQARYDEHHGREASGDGERVQNYLVWDADCPVSLHSSLANARHNARTIREVISREVWETINDAWLWFSSPEARSAFDVDRIGFYQELKHRMLQCQGALASTMLRDEALDWIGLGMNLERAGQTARVLDVKHHMLGPTDAQSETTEETIVWMYILLSVSAYEGFFKRSSRSLRGFRVARFLLLDVALPQSVRRCLMEAAQCLERITVSPATRKRKTSWVRLDALRHHLSQQSIDTLVEAGIHDELTRIVDETGAICADLYSDYFHFGGPERETPAPEELAAEPTDPTPDGQ